MISGKSQCGLQYAVRRSSSAVGYCALSIKCGTRNEADYHSGIAHFCEHTIFKGTEKKSAAVINSCLDRLGGELNAFTTKEEIVFHATTLREDVSKAASLLFELATMPVFPEEEIGVEKGVVIDEINSYKDSPAEDVYDKFEEMLFEGHPLSSPILGTAASVKKITSNELRAFVKEKFLPSRMAFTLVADIDEKKMEKLVLTLADRFFSDCVEPAAVVEDRLFLPVARHFDRSVNKRNHQTNCVIGGLAPSLYDSKDRITAILLSNIFGGPANNSILNSVLREKNGWVYGVECSYTQYSDCGIITICLGCDRENLDKCLKFIDKELLKLKTRPLSERKLKEAKKQLLGQLAISSDNGEAQCLSMGKSLMAFGKVTTAAESGAMIEAVTAEDIRILAQKLFDENNLSKLVFY